MPKHIEKQITYRGVTYVTIPRLCEILQIDRRTFWRRVKDGTFPKPIEVVGTHYVPESLASDILNKAFATA